MLLREYITCSFIECVNNYTRETAQRGYRFLTGLDNVELASMDNVELASMNNVELASMNKG